MNKKIIILCLGMLAAMSASAQRAMNRPYVDDKLFHFGFSLGVNFMDYSVRTFANPLSGELVEPTGERDQVKNAVIDGRCSYMIPGFSVGFIGDLRLCNYLNLRLIPQLHFAERDIWYRYEKTVNGETQEVKHKTSLLCIPISVPLELKWSAQRCGNYRPFCTVGGGVSYNCFENKEKPVVPQRLDYFMEIGAGCDFYFSWFKLCPQIKYQLGFNNLAPDHLTEDQIATGQTEPLNSAAIDRLRSHTISIIFNFE